MQDIQFQDLEIVAPTMNHHEKNISPSRFFILLQVFNPEAQYPPFLPSLPRAVRRR